MRASNIQGMYSSFDEILSELKARRGDKILRKKVSDFLGAHGFPYHKDHHRAFFSRSIMTPNFELAYFMDLARDLGLDPMLLEYPDKLVGKNPAKYRLCKLQFHDDDNRRKLGDGIKVADMASQEGMRVTDVRTVTGEPLVDLHHRLLYKHFPELNGKLVDFFDWFNASRGKEEEYYLCYLALFVCDGVLFENFLHEDKEETAFVLDRILPSFNKACEIFGVKPLIFPLLPIEHERSNDWLAYPLSMKTEIELYLKKQ